MMPKINSDNSRAAQSFLLNVFVQLFKRQSVSVVSLNATFVRLCLCVRETKQMMPVASRIKRPIKDYRNCYSN